MDSAEIKRRYPRSDNTAIKHMVDTYKLGLGICEACGNEQPCLKVHLLATDHVLTLCGTCGAGLKIIDDEIELKGLALGVAKAPSIVDLLKEALGS